MFLKAPIIVSVDPEMDADVCGFVNNVYDVA